MRAVVEECRPPKKRGQYRIVIAVAMCMAGILAAPGVALSSAREGLDLFMTIVLPTLLPFFIFSRLLLETPVAEDAGRLLEPVMRPLFGCPGPTAFAMTVSFLSGYPAGSRIVAALYEQGRLRNDELRRAACLCSTSGPIFMLGAVGVGMFGSERIGWLILLSHYQAVILTGILTGGLRPREPPEKAFRSTAAPPARWAPCCRRRPRRAPPSRWWAASSSSCSRYCPGWRSISAYRRGRRLLSWPLRWMGCPKN
jgi:hypothetical protein